MHDITMSPDFLASVSTMSREKKIVALYKRLLCVDDASINGIPVPVLERMLKERSDHAPLLRIVLKTNEYSTI